ncbi:MAG: ATP-binding protein [Verrucomicrobiota bacterium]|jgi:two-component system sensor histidine kinase PhcS
MFKNPTSSNHDFADAFVANERQERLRTGKIASVLVVVLMPLGSIMDWLFYHPQRWYFLELRLLCSVLTAGLWYLHTAKLGQKHYRLVGIPIALLPGFFMCWIIAAAQGPLTGATSNYYAALNLILLAVSVVVRWDIWESTFCVAAIILMYLAACGFHWLKPTPEEFFNNLAINLYFLALTGIIVIVGNHFFYRLRLSEFTLRYELDKSRKALEASLQQLKENEMQLVQTEKLASLGRMSAGIIHEINNPLNFATTGLFTLRNKGQYLAPEQQADYAEILSDVEEGVKRVKTIVSDLRMFTHPETESRDQVAVAEVVASALRFLSNECKDKVQIDQQIAGNQTIWANKNKLIHLVTNLLQNSLDALKTKPFRDEKPTIRIEGRIENGSSILSVRDNGPGIAPADVGKIFDPFFTTKDVGAGMGLGLSICYRIVKESGGKISVKTEPGKFCEFTLEFPVRTNQATN